jgi:hypothetical protein
MNWTSAFLRHARLALWLSATLAVPSLSAAEQASGAAAPKLAVPDPGDPRLKVGDYIQTRNGSILWGRLKMVEFGSVRFEIVDVEEASIKLRDIVVLIARSTNFQVDLQGQRRITTMIDATGQGGTMRVSGPAGSVDVAIADVVRIKRVDRTFLERLDGTVSLGYSYTSASEIGRFTFVEAAIYATERNQLFQHYSTVMTLGDEPQGPDRVDAGLGNMFAVRGRYLVAQYGQYQKIQATGIDWRWLSISGGGLRLVHRRFLNLDVVSGLTLTQERVTTGESSDVQAELPLMVGWRLGFPVPKLSAEGRTTLFRSFSVSDRYRIDSRTAIDYELYNHSAYGTVTFGAQVLYSRDSKPLTDSQKQKDLNVSLTLGYTF